MPTRIFDNDGVSAIVAKDHTYPDSDINVEPEIIRFVDPDQGSAPACYIFCGRFNLGRSANADISTALDGSVYYTVFGENPIPLTMSGYVLVPTVTNKSGGDNPYNPSHKASARFMDFLDEKLASQPQPRATDTVHVRVEGAKQYRGIVHKSQLQYVRKGNPALLFKFNLEILVIHTVDLR